MGVFFTTSEITRILANNDVTVYMYEGLSALWQESRRFLFEVFEAIEDLVTAFWPQATISFMIHCLIVTSRAYLWYLLGNLGQHKSNVNPVGS